VDPDEYLIREGAEAFEKVLSNAADALTFKWKQLSRQFAASNDLTGQQKAVQEYLETLAKARGSGPVDNLRWGAALTRVSRLTEIPVDALNRRFRSTQPRGTAQPARSAEATQRQDSPSQTPKRVTAQDRAEIELLGSLLVEPQRWHDVQQQLGPQEFTDPSRRKLAELYWRIQQDEGEPVFNQFLGEIQEPELVELAIQLVEAVEALADMEKTFAGALGYFEEVRRLAKQQKQVSQLRRTDAEVGEQNQVDLLKGLQEQARQPNLRRVV
jgi:DNA primase